MEVCDKIRDYYEPPVGGLKEISEEWGNGFRTRIVQEPVEPIGDRHRCYNCGLVSLPG